LERNEGQIKSNHGTSDCVTWKRMWNTKRRFKSGMREDVSAVKKKMPKA